MARSISAHAKPALLQWGRESAGLSLDQAAKRIDVGTEKLAKWESGEESPTIAELRRLGDAYKRPIAVFFLPAPPREFDAQREFRRLAGLRPEAESPELRLALRQALFRREAARSVYERLGEKLPTFEDEAHPNEDAEENGRRLRERLGITWEKQLKWTSGHAALNGWRSAVENLGILVFQVGKVSLNEMRGTSIPHGPLPVILINNADAPHGRVFTLLHEFAHVLLWNGGHRTSPIEGRQLPEDQLLEQVSNRMAAAALMPSQEFLAEAERYTGVFSGDDESLHKFANRIKVSPEAILRRLLALQQIPSSLYRQKRRVWQSRPWKSKETPGKGGPPQEVKVLAGVGRAFVSLMLEGYHRNAVSSSDVSDFLGVKLQYLPRIEKAMIPRPGAVAP